MFAQQQSSSRNCPRHRRRRGAPGLIACSRSSDEILQRSPSVSLSPVTGPGTTFSSVASAFDFQHHVGSDPASELLVLKHILTRECLLSRLEAVCGSLRKRFQLPAAKATADSGTTARNTEDGNGVVALLSRMRDATVAVIEAISVWRKDMTGHLPPAFVWHGDNYLLKITNDLNFLAGVQPLVDTLKMHPARFCRNPLMLPQTLDEQRRDGELCESGVNTTSPGAGKRRHLYQVAQVLLDEEGLERERDYLRQESSKIVAATSGRGETSPELSGRHGFNAGNVRCAARPCATTSSVRKGGSQRTDVRPFSYSASSFACGRDPVTDDEELRRHQGGLSTWYEQARSQLVSLSSSPADEEYFLSSRRFWSKEELGDSMGGSSPPALHRKPPGTIARGGKRSGYTMSAAAASGRGGGSEAGQRDATGRLSNDGTYGDNGGADLFGERPQNHHQRGFPPPRQQTRSTQGVPAHGQEGGQFKAGGGGGHSSERGGADVWSRPDRFGDGNSAALSCLTVDDIEQILRELNPLPATVAVCAAVVFLLGPEDQLPSDFLWPQGFEAVALPAEDFLRRLHETSGQRASSSKAQFLAPVLQREHLLPEVIERQGGHAVASLCAWALEELQDCDEFADWSGMALEPWYETQVVPPAHAQENPTDCSDDVDGCEVRLIYKALHKLPHVGASYVLSLFEGKSGEGGLIVRAFDRVRRDTFWLSLSRNKVDAFGSNATRSPSALATALTRRLKMKPDVAAGTQRLVLVPIKKIEPCSDKNRKNTAATSASISLSADGDGTEADPRGVVNAEANPESTPSPSNEDPRAAALPPQGSAQRSPKPRRSHPPAMRGSRVDDLGPLVEAEGDGSECSARDGAGTQSVPTVVDADGADAADENTGNQSGVEPVEVAVLEEKSIDHQIYISSRLYLDLLGRRAKRCPPPALSSRSLQKQIRSPHPADSHENMALAGEITGDREKEEPAVQTTKAVEQAQALPAESRNDDGQGGLAGTEMEASGSYADDFTVKDNNEAGPGLLGGAGIEESGSYADDFTADEDENFYDDEDDQMEIRERVDQLARAGEETAAASDVVRGGGGTTGSALSDADVCPDKTTVSELVVSGPCGTEYDGRPSEGVHAREESKAEDDYGNELSEEEDEHDQSAKTNVVAPSNRTAAFLVEPEEARSSSIDVPAAGGGGALASQTPRSENYDKDFGDVEGTSATGAGAEPEQYVQEPDDGLRRSPGETASDPSVSIETTAVDEPGGADAAERELLAEGGSTQEVQSHEGGDLETRDDEAQQQSLPTTTTHHTDDLSLASISIDSLGNMAKVSAGEGYASEFEDAPEEAIQDDVQTSMASEVAAAVVAAAASSALERVSESSGSDAPSLAVDSTASTKEAEATQNDYPEDGNIGTEAVVSMTNPSAMQQRQPSGQSEPPNTSRTSLIEFEGRFADTADDNDTEEMSVRSGDTHEVAAAEVAAEADAEAEAEAAAESSVPVSAPESTDHANENDCFLTDDSVQDIIEEVGVQEDPPLVTNQERLVPQTSTSSRDEESGADSDAVPAIAVVADAAEEGEFEMKFEQEEADPAQPPTRDTAGTEEVRSVPGDTPFPAEPSPSPSLEGNPAAEVDDENEGAGNTMKKERHLSAAPEDVPSPSLSGEEPRDEGLSRGPVGEQAEGGGEAKETHSMTEGEDFEDFEEDFASAGSDEEDRVVGFDNVQTRQKTSTPEASSREETLVASAQQDGGGGAEAFSESEDLHLPESIATAGAGDESVTGSEEREPCGESSQREAMGSRQSVEEAENREEDGARRGSVDQVLTPSGITAAATATAAAAPATAGVPELSDEDGDDFEDDFEDP
ncbi:unnamed protein product [Ectocarpus sp. CCAP 1310/34]|nr:unnamed protein product [Ectocarpus sp. CCAP 1310/34]